MVTQPTGAGTGADESLIAGWGCVVGFFAHVSGFFTDDVVGCQKTGTLFSLVELHWRWQTKQFRSKEVAT